MKADDTYNEHDLERSPEQSETETPAACVLVNADIADYVQY